jgi:hypothetical protein
MHFKVDEQKSFYRYCTAAPPDYGEIFVGSNVQTVKTTKNNRKIFYYDSGPYHTDPKTKPEK